MIIRDIGSMVNSGARVISATVSWEDCDFPDQELIFEMLEGGIDPAADETCPDAFLAACSLGDLSAAMARDVSSPQDISLSEKYPMHHGSPVLLSFLVAIERCNELLNEESKTSGNLPQYPSLPSTIFVRPLLMASVYGVNRRRKTDSSDQLPIVLRPQLRSR